MGSDAKLQVHKSTFLWMIQWMVTSPSLNGFFFISASFETENASNSFLL